VVRSFRPELLIADHQPLGLSGELAPALHAARALGTRTILGLRDIIDEPAAVAREWGAREVREALAEAYERVLVYGSPEVFDPRREYSIPPELAERLEFTGYVVRDPAPRAVRPLPALRPQVLVTAGGGEDGVERIELYLDALALAPAAWDSSLVLGPLMDPLAARALQRRARSCVSVQVHRFHADLPRLLQDCDAVVSMAGYNSVAEILQCRASAVLLPRRFPRREQLLRAERLAARGLVRTLAQPSAGALRETLEAALAEGPPRAPRPQLDGREQVVRIGCELLEREPAAVSLPGAARR